MLIASQRASDIASGSERAFVFRTVANLASKVHRSRRRHPEDPEDAEGELVDGGLNPEELLEQRRAREALDGVLKALPADLRAAFVLFEIEGLSQPEIAAALGIPTGTVASRVRRAREAFTRIAVQRGVLPESPARKQ
jgi:RNA polymerase sigma-70 factor (ECF subfamily)